MARGNGVCLFCVLCSLIDGDSFFAVRCGIRGGRMTSISNTVMTWVNSSEHLFFVHSAALPQKSTTPASSVSFGMLADLHFSLDAADQKS